MDKCTIFPVRGVKLMIKQSTVLFILLSISACNNIHYLENLSDFEKMMSRFPSCSLKDVYVDMYTEMPTHKYFLDRNLKPSKITGGFAYFDIDETYHGLKVYEIVIPASTYPSYSIYFQEPVAKVRKRIKNLYYRGFNPKSKIIINFSYRPKLFAHPKDNQRSILRC